MSLGDRPIMAVLTLDFTIMLLLAFLVSMAAAPQDEPDLQACLTEDSGMLGMLQCYDDDLGRQRAALAAVLARIDSKLERWPATLGVRPAEARRALNQAQALWAESADADCLAGEALFGEGNAFALDRLECDSRHVEARIAELLAFEQAYLWTADAAH